MSIAMPNRAQPSGLRRLTPPMLAARETADRFAGSTIGTADRFRYLAAFQEAEPYLRLPAHSYKLVSWLVGQTMPHDWEEGSRPIAWPSARLQQEFLGLSPARVKMLNRTLFEAGIFVIRDNEQGKRYGRRGPDKRIIEAYGFDLSLLALRCEEFIRLAAEARVERGRMKDLRRRITIARRSIAALGELLIAADTVPEGWPELVTEAAAHVAQARKLDRSTLLEPAAAAVEDLNAQAMGMARRASKPVNTHPTQPVPEPHTTSTNLSLNLSDTVIAAEKGGRVETVAPAAPSLRNPMPEAGVAGIRRPEQLLELMPRLAQYVWGDRVGWREIVEAAGSHLRHDLGVSLSLWHDACRVMGREAAALTLAIVSTKSETHFSSSAGGYFGGMVRKAEKGELHLERTLWALREAKWGKSRTAWPDRPTA